MQRNLLSFECTAFGEPLWSDSAGNVELAEQLARAIARTLDAEDAHELESFGRLGTYGWEFIVRRGGCRIWCALQRSDGWLLITEARRSLLDRLSGRNFEAVHGEFCEAADRAVRGLPGVTAVSWRTRDEFDRRATGRERPS